jgi:excisionase family DNA binding protein
MAIVGKPVQAVPSPVLTAAEVCELLRINRSTVYRLIKERKIPSFRVGSEHRFSREAIDAWCQAQEEKFTSNGTPVTGALSEVLPTPPSRRRGRPPHVGISRSSS